MGPALLRPPFLGKFGGRHGRRAATLLAILVAGCTAAPPRPPKIVEVVVTTPIRGEVMDSQDFTGRLDAILTVDVRPRVTGYVNEAPFKEGDLVRKGDVLFEIDPRPYKAALAQAEANLKLAIADRNLQESNATRARQLLGSRSMGREEYDQIMASREKSKAAVLAAEAARELSSFYMVYTEVTSPLSGRVSRRNVDPGNLVKADDTLLTTIVSDSSVYAYFDVDERTYLDLVGKQAAASSSSKSQLAALKFPVLMRLANEEEFTHPGQVNFVDNRLSGNTGTIRMRGIFPNPRGALKAGLFVRIRLPIGKPYRPLLVPDDALQSDQGRKFVYVLDKEDRVEYRAVKLGQAIHGLRVIKEGLIGGERVIVEGMQRVKPKDQVEVKTQAPPRPPDFPFGKLFLQKDEG